jgi:hypothetical protein
MRHLVATGCAFTSYVDLFRNFNISSKPSASMAVSLGDWELEATFCSAKGRVSINGDSMLKSRAFEGASNADSSGTSEGKCACLVRGLGGVMLDLKYCSGGKNACCCCRYCSSPWSQSFIASIMFDREGAA